ncbi:MAG: FHA domain-containing protein [Chloroflexota bacterium]
MTTEVKQEFAMMPPVRDTAMIVLQQGADSTKRWALRRDRPTMIGRNDDCEIVLPDRQVSRYHARISWNNEQYEIEDLGSKNGTHINGENALSAISLKDGDEFQIGLRFKLSFIDADATMPLSLEKEVTGLHLDKETRQVWINGELIEPALSLPQYRLLEIMWDSGGRVVTRDEIVNAVWPDDSMDGISEQAIDALVRRLRERLADLDGDYKYIVTVRGHGFRLDNR